MILQRLDTLRIKDEPSIKAEVPEPPAGVKPAATLSIKDDPWGKDMCEKPKHIQQPSTPTSTTTTMALEVKWDGVDPWHHGEDEATRRRTQADNDKPEVPKQTGASSSVAITVIRKEEIVAAHEEIKRDTQEDHPWNAMAEQQAQASPLAAVKHLQTDRSKYKAPVNSNAPDGGNWSSYSWANQAGSRGNTSWGHRSYSTTPTSTSTATRRAPSTSRHWTAPAPPPWKEASWKEAPWKR